MICQFGRVSVVVMFLSACQLMPDKTTQTLDDEGSSIETQTAANHDDTFCIVSLNEEQVLNNCNMDYWLRFWSEIEQKSWTERKLEIENLGFDAESTLKKILLSQGKGTPYKDRFRAQNWLESLLPKLTPEMRNFTLVAIYQVSQDLLEMESALVSLSRVNATLTNKNEQQKLLIEKQKNQIYQLLKIEASIMDSGNGDNK